MRRLALIGCILAAGCATQRTGALQNTSTVVGLQIDSTPQTSVPLSVKVGLIRNQYTFIAASNTANVTSWTDAEQMGWNRMKVHTGLAQWTGNLPPPNSEPMSFDFFTDPVLQLQPAPSSAEKANK